MKREARAIPAKNVGIDDDSDGAADHGSDSTDDGVEEPWDKKIAALMKEKNISYDAAASILHRAEKIAKGFV